MERNDRQAIEGLFENLAIVERQAPPRDPEAEAFIHQRIAGQPGAPYFMAQTIVVQEQALAAAQARIEALEGAVESRSRGSGGLLSGLFGDSRPSGRPAGSVPSVGRGAPPSPAAVQGRSGSGFLAGAAQTAMGVAGGVLLGNAIAGMFSGEAAQAAEPVADDPGMDESGFEDGGFGDDIEF